MTHKAIDHVLGRAERGKQESDLTYFFDLLLAAEAIAKLATCGMVSAIADDKDRNRYRLEHALVRADGLGDWGRVLDDCLSGPASHYLLADAQAEKADFTRLCKHGDWQHQAVIDLKSVLERLNIEAEAVPVKTDLKRWFRLLATLRNKTRGHGAVKSVLLAGAAPDLRSSIDSVVNNALLFKRPWFHLYRNLSGKYRVSPIAGDCRCVEHLKKESSHAHSNGVYVNWVTPRRTSLFVTDADLSDFYIANGNCVGRRYELLSYTTGNKIEGDGAEYATPPGALPESETSSRGELVVRGKCLTSAPEPLKGYVSRPALEAELRKLVVDDRRAVVTLRGRGGIGKTSLALAVLGDVYKQDRFVSVVWLSARDVDLQLGGPKPVRPQVVTLDDMGRLFASLVLSPEAAVAKGFDPKRFMEEQMNGAGLGATLFVFDNFETIQNPLDTYAWIDTFIRLPNKALITTRLRDFKGDYPVDVNGMTEDESRELIRTTSLELGVTDRLKESYISEIVEKSQGHPYIIKILLGEVAITGQAKSVKQLVATSDEILTALFERTFATLSPCAQRAFLTLAAWNSPVPRVALEAVLQRSTGERHEVESGIEALIQYSIAEVFQAADGTEFLELPLAASLFGKKKLNISQQRPSIEADVGLLQLFGPSRRDDQRLGLTAKVESLIRGIADRIEHGGVIDDYRPMLDMICRSYNQGWLIMGRWHLEQARHESVQDGRHALEQFLENDPRGPLSSEAWRLLASACYRQGDALGEVHAFVERAQLASVPYYDVSSTANRLNAVLRETELGADKDVKEDLARRLLGALRDRVDEADADDFSRMAWLAIHTGQEGLAREYVCKGLAKDQQNFHCQKLAQRLGL